MSEIIIKGSTKEQIEAFATFCGWSKQIMTTTESPNYLVDNTESAIEYLKRTQLKDFVSNLAYFKSLQDRQVIQDKMKAINDELEELESSAKADAQSLISVTLE